MVRKLLAATLLLLATSSARALEYTDVWITPSELGWGVFVVQSNTFQFLAFFIYGPDGKPTWYVAGLNDDGTGQYTGELFATSGTYFPLPWNPAQYAGAAIGTASFAPIDSAHATLTYTVAGVGTVTKTIERQTLTGYLFGGNYSGSASGSVTGCTNPLFDDPAFRARYNLGVIQNGDASASLTFTFVDPKYTGMVCTVAGPLTHLGRGYQLNGQATCIGPGLSGVAQSATINGLHPTGQGIEGRWLGALAEGCSGTIRFAAVQNN